MAIKICHHSAEIIARTTSGIPTIILAINESSFLFDITTMNAIIIEISTAVNKFIVLIFSLLIFQYEFACYLFQLMTYLQIQLCLLMPLCLLEILQNSE